MENLEANPDHRGRTGPGAVEAPEESNCRTPPPLLQRILYLSIKGTFLFWSKRGHFYCGLTRAGLNLDISVRIA